MKKLIYLLLVAGMITSCTSSKVIRESKKTLKGEWNLESISYSESGVYNVNLLNDVSSECMAGSKWRFIPNNNSGNYEVNANDCANGQRYFIWNIVDSDGDASNYDILLKPTDAKLKSSTNNKGFRMRISYLSNDKMTMSQTVQSDGKPFTITMNFTNNLN